MNKFDKAFKELKARMLVEGAEFPDVVFDISCEYNVSESELTKMYDTWQAS
jgi:hypothetical protein